MKTQRSSDPNIPVIVGVGASAGGLEAFRGLLEGLGSSPGVAIAFAQHFDPNNKGLLVDLLAESTEMDVVDLAGRRKIKPNTVYICPPDKFTEVQGSFLRLSKEAPEQPSLVIDHLLHSIADHQPDRGIGVILSGAGSDGTLGLKAISDHGGLTFAQDPESAKFDAMPRSAATTGVADHVMAPPEIAAEILRYTSHLAQQANGDSDEPLHDAIAKAIPAICEILMQATNHNFQHYKINTLSRRIQRRMQILKIADASDYVDVLKNDADEPQSLFRELLIGVTTFFRDPETFDTLKKGALKKLFSQRTNENPVRIWVAGCANGAEAYTMAILCREVIDECEADVEVQIFATDIDERALQHGRTGAFPLGIQDHVSPERLERFFVKKGKRYHVAKEIRELVLFSAHNLISDPPFSRLDLISCRNLLIYLGPHLQNKLIPLFHYALRPGGYLLLGPSENLTSHQELFRPVDAKHRISQRNGTAAGKTPSISLRDPTLDPKSRDSSSHPVDLTAIAQRIVLDEFAPKYAVINESCQILNSSADLEKYVHFQGGDYQNSLIKMVHPSLRIALRSTLGEAIKVRRRIEHDNLSIRIGDTIQRVMLTVQPMPRLGEDESLFMVVFHDVGLPVEHDDVQQKAIQFNSDSDSLISQMERELETTRKDLDQTLQDMEAANEELKSSNEELLSMNEELQTANEELEASKEEARSGSDAVARANDDLENLLRSTRIATVFLDDEFRIRSFTPAIDQIYDLIATDIGRPLSMFVPKVQDMPPLPTVQTKQVAEDTILAESGKTYLRRVLPYRSHTGENEGIVVTFMDVTQLAESQERFELLVKASAQIVWITDAEGLVTLDSPSWREFTGQSFDEWVGHGWLEAIHPDDRAPTMERWQRCVQDETPFVAEYRLRHHEGQYRWTQVRGIAQRNVDGSIRQWIGMNIDIDDRKRSEMEVAESRQRLELGIELGKLGIGRVDYVKNEITLSPEAARLYGLGDEPISVSRQRLHAIFHPDDQSSVADCINASLDPAGSRRCEVEHRIILPDGSVRWMNVCKQINFDDTVTPPAPQFATMVALDITDQKEREQETTEREAQLRRVIDNMLNFVGVLSPNGVLLEVNATALAAGGIEREDVIGKPFWDCYWWSHSERVTKELREAVQKVSRGEVIRYDAEVRMAGDTRMTIDFMMVPVRDGDGTITHLIPSGVDVSARVQAEQEIRNANAKLRVLFDQAFYYTGLLDLEGHLVDINAAALEPFGFERDGVLGLPFWETAWWADRPDSQEKLRAGFARALDGEVYHEELGFDGPDGSNCISDFVFTPATDDDGKVMFIVANGSDVTERHEYQTAIRLNEERIRLATSAAGVATFHIDPIHRQAHWSDELKRLIGQNVDEEMSDDFSQIPDWIHPEDQSKTDAFIQRLLSDLEEPDHWLDLRIVRRNGDVRHVRMQTRSLYDDEDDDRKLSLVVGTFLDVTQQREFEQQLERERHAAQAANESKSAFVANMSHEIRTPMTAILGYTDLIREHLTDPEALGHLQTIRRNGDYLLDIINDILDLSKIESGKLDVEHERFDPSLVVEDVRSFMEVRASEANLELDVRYRSKIPALIQSDAKRLKQILINLVGNAIKFTKKGKVEIRVSYDEHLRFEIADTGIGMSEEQSRKLFQPFQQGDSSVSRKFGGTGLGLAISRRLAEVLGGGIEVESELNQGSVFTATVATGELENVPLVKPKTDEDTLKEELSSAEPEEDVTELNCHILVVDDRRDIRFLSKRILTRVGARVEEAQDGRFALEAVTKAMDAGETFDLIVLDMQMPNLDGYETAAALRKLGFTNPIIALTADAMQGDMKKCLEAGCNDYLSKPIDAQELLRLVDELLRA